MLATNDHNLVHVAGGVRLHFPSDRYAFLPVAAAASYFEAWRVWARQLRCDHPCYAGLQGDHPLARWRGKGNGECGPNVTLNVINGCGECPLATWLSESRERFLYARAPTTGNPIVRQLNRSHAAYQGSEGRTVPITDVVIRLAEVHRRRATCLEHLHPAAAARRHGTRGARASTDTSSAAVGARPTSTARQRVILRSGSPRSETDKMETSKASFHLE